MFGFLEDRDAYFKELGFREGYAAAKAESKAARELALKALRAFKSDEWSNRGDWQGFCAFRRALGCRGTDGHVSALGAPQPKPHSESCPYNGLNAAIAALEGK